MDIITMAREIGKAIQQDDRYIVFHKAKDVADADKDLQDMIGEFNLKKLELQGEIQNQNRSSEKMQAIDSQLKALYGKIMDNPNMIAYNVAKKGLDDLLNFVNQIVVYSANGEDPDSIEMQEQQSCGGSCSSCSGCN